jgi:hypothetical protein
MSVDQEWGMVCRPDLSLAPTHQLWIVLGAPKEESSKVEDYDRFLGIAVQC